MYVFKQGTVLRTLSLEGNELGVPGVAAIAEAVRLQRRLVNLNLACTSFANNGNTRNDLAGLVELIRTMRQTPSLIRINLGGNAIGEVGVKLLLDNLIDVTHIIQLDVTHDCETTTFAALMEWLKRNHPVKKTKKKKPKKKKGLDLP